MSLSKIMMVLVLGMEAFLFGCTPEGAPDLTNAEAHYVQYPGGTWVYTADGKKFMVYLNGKYLIFEEIK